MPDSGGKLIKGGVFLLFCRAAIFSELASMLMRDPRTAQVTGIRCPQPPKPPIMTFTLGLAGGDEEEFDVGVAQSLVRDERKERTGKRNVPFNNGHTLM
jgi:hypothetical protein